ncbi:MAG: hemerythrin family protein [Sulfuricellaceae bacterium]
MYFMWHDSYSVGYDPIDHQHQKLFTISNDLTEATEKSAGANEKELRNIICDLLTYARTHFAEEEQLMRQTAFPDFARHKALHEAFDAKIHEVEKQVLNGEVHAVASFLPQLIGDWLLDHIATEDQQYAAYIKTALP